MSVSALAAAWLLGCSKEPQRAVSQPSQKVERINPLAAATEPASPVAADFDKSLPEIHGPPGYVGSGACRSCHEDQYTSWHRSYHRSMTQVVNDESVQANFGNVMLTTDSARFTLNKRDGEFWVKMEPLVTPAAESSTTPALERRLAIVTGSHHMQVFWVPEGDGNLQLGFPFTWLIPEKRWVPRNSTFVRPPDMQHRSEVWNVVCSRCHTTGVQPRVNFAAHTAQTQVAELGISCEACHGPGEPHVQAQKASARKSVALGEIIHPKKISAQRSAEICGFCHSMKWIDKSSTWRENGFQYRPGDELEDTTPIIRPSRVDSIPGLKDYLTRNPEILRDFFWPDGMMRVSGREYNGLIESPCYKGGKFACISCHSLHESEPNAQLAEKAKANGACLQCHEKFREEKVLTAHTHHLADSSGTECYNCHMPYTTYGILKSIRSHQISNPSVRSDLQSGRLNACNLCHIDQTLGWTAQLLARWYGQPELSSVSQEAGSTMDSTADSSDEISQLTRLALTGDAGQRVLAAWHLSWSPALHASRTNFVPVILAELLDDPYGAVRCVAERSSRTIGLALPPGYDFTIDPRVRAPVREEIWNRLHGSAAFASGALFNPDGTVDRNRIERLLARRNNAPVRLRE